MEKCAIIGSGISGLVSAYLLSRRYQVTLFEKNDYIGGHTATVDVEVQGRKYALDTGFIVFNDKTYPNFIALLDKLGIEKQASEMSFSINNLQTGLQYNGHDLNTLFAQRRNLVNLQFWGLLKEIWRFNQLCIATFEASRFDEQTTLGQFLLRHRFSSFFAEHYILPMGAAIWSTSVSQMAQFQMSFFIRFFYHHGLLNVTDRPQWYVIPGGSRSYIAPLIKSFKHNIELNAKISKVCRTEQQVALHFADGTAESFDEVVFACHSDQALKLLSDATDAERQVLGALPYSENEVVLHTDESLLPSNRRAWASWNYLLDDRPKAPAAVTYNMNILQSIEAPCTFCVTLNQTERIDPQKILKQFKYDHPVYDINSEKARARRGDICGHRHTHFAGAYWYNGFHEDGVKSALDVAQRLNCFNGW
jgi:predicted NAD/FAD-binding protein